MHFARKLLLLLWLVVTIPALAQNCPLPPILRPASSDRNIFSDQQESDLGDAIAQQLGIESRVVDDETLTAPLRRVGERLTPYLPANHFRIEFFLVDMPGLEAFSLPGGRVYVSRKLISSLRSEDELAGIVAHELGHVVTHQIAISMSGEFRQVLRVNHVADRSDVFDKFQRMQEVWRLHPPHSEEESEQDQYVADAVSIYVLGRSGYNPRALVDWWDRMTETHGKTGSWFSDILGTTKPDQRRLREMLKSGAAMPRGCVEASPAVRTSNFESWQRDVIAFHSSTHHASLSGVLFKQSLALPLRPDTTNLRFSPDGKYLLAQDEGGIHVIFRQSLAVLFFVDAPDAKPASFSPDSSKLVFYTPSLRVETWDVASQKRSSVHELIIRDGCYKDALSPDGNFLACLDAKFTLKVYGVADNAAFASKDGFVPSWRDAFLLSYGASMADVSLINIAFSPDSRYMLAGNSATTWSVDLTQRREISFPSSIRNLARGSLAFVGDDRIAGVDPENPAKSPVLRFPSGERVAQLPLANTSHLARVGHGNYLLVWPVRDHPLGIMDLQTREVLVSFKHSSGDIYDGILLVEHISGEITLVDLAAHKTVGVVRLGQSRLGALKASAVSPDLNWLAVSTRTRGAFWDLAHDIRIGEVRAFTGAWFDENNVLYADFPKFEDKERSIALLDTFGRTSIVYDLAKLTVQQAGPYLLVRTSANEKGLQRKNWNVEVRDFRTKTTLWSRSFPRQVPGMNLNPTEHTLLLGWRLDEGAARDELAHYPALKADAGKEDYLFELVDFRGGKSLGAVVVKTNKASFTVDDAIEDGGWLAVSVDGDRTLVYALTDTAQAGHVFGSHPVLCAASRNLAVTTAAGDVDVYRLPGNESLHSYKFSAPVAFKRFSPDGKRLFVLTRDQTAYILDLTVP
jgi:WD40 repeat protein